MGKDAVASSLRTICYTFYKVGMTGEMCFPDDCADMHWEKFQKLIDLGVLVSRNDVFGEMFLRFNPQGTRLSTVLSCEATLPARRHILDT